MQGSRHAADQQVRVALQVATAPATVEDGDLDLLRQHGFEAEDVWDIGAIAALFAMSNRMAHLTALRPNPEFHLLGRVPRDVRAAGPAAR